jgi:hypothetical protein
MVVHSDSVVAFGVVEAEVGVFVITLASGLGRALLHIHVGLYLLNPFAEVVDLRVVKDFGSLVSR